MFFFFICWTLLCSYYLHFRHRTVIYMDICNVSLKALERTTHTCIFIYKWSLYTSGILPKVDCDPMILVFRAVFLSSRRPLCAVPLYNNQTSYSWISTVVVHKTIVGGAWASELLESMGKHWQFEYWMTELSTYNSL